MKTNTKHLLKREEGFTLVEVIAVLIILGILAAVAVPKYINLEEDAKKRAIDAAISELNGRESMTWAQVKISANPMPATDAAMDTAVITAIKAATGPSYSLNLTGGNNYTWKIDPPVPVGGTDYIAETLIFQGSKEYTVKRTAGSMQTPAIWTRTSN